MFVKRLVAVEQPDVGVGRSCSYSYPRVVYTVSITKTNTNMHNHRNRPNTVTDLCTGVNLCLINRHTNNAILKRIDYFSLNKVNSHEFEFEAEYIFDVTDVLVSPESGHFNVAKVNVVQSLLAQEVNQAIDLRELQNTLFEPDISNDNKTKAYPVLFTPVRVFSPERKAENDVAYSNLKQEINIWAAVYAVIGTTFTGVVFSPSDAFAFAIGSVMASMYNVMLQAEMDSIGKNKDEMKLFVDTGTGSGTGTMIRLGILAVSATLVVQYYSENIQEHHMYYILGLLGFMSYKLSFMRSIK